MGQDPVEIREEIAQTREDMGQTVDALGHKADVKGRVAGYVTDKKDALMGTVSENTPDGAAVKEKGPACRTNRPGKPDRSCCGGCCNRVPGRSRASVHADGG